MQIQISIAKVISHRIKVTPAAGYIVIARVITSTTAIDVRSAGDNCPTSVNYIRSSNHGRKASMCAVIDSKTGCDN